MVELKLARIPDRTPVKVTISVTPDLNDALAAYADVYRSTYGQAESVTDLIPYMLRSFLDGDRAFLLARRSNSS